MNLSKQCSNKKKKSFLVVVVNILFDFGLLSDPSARYCDSGIFKCEIKTGDDVNYYYYVCPITYK